MSLDCLNDSQNEFNKNVQEALEGINEIFRDPLVQVYFFSSISLSHIHLFLN